MSATVYLYSTLYLVAYLPAVVSLIKNTPQLSKGREEEKEEKKYVVGESSWWIWYLLPMIYVDVLYYQMISIFNHTTERKR